ncbi:MAG TPA: DUF1858 domain-containing protein [Clostridiaceae bacterium]|jgi:hybrid cluster-associated redox disulfide protein|nr:DUF1858 domain-containing protein [Clostridiaceae bacterium]
MKVTKDTLIIDIIRIDRNLAGLLMGHGLHCVGCMMANNETLEEACQVHDIDVDFLLNDINTYLSSIQALKD